MPRSDNAQTPGSGPLAGLELRLLGAPCLVLGERRIGLSAKDAALLCLAALAGPIRADRAASLLWPAVSANQADTSLRQRLYRLRRETGAPLLNSGPLLQLAAGVQTDLAPSLARIGLDEHAALDECSVTSTTTTCPTWPSGFAGNANTGASSATPLRCPAKNKSAQRATGAPVDDVIGVRPGMSYDGAANAVLCSHDLLVLQLDVTRGFNLKTQGQKLRHGFGARFAEPRVEWTAKRAKIESMDDIVARTGNAARDDMKPGQAKWYVGTMGLPGQERVINVAREERFEVGASPTSASVEQALLAKYGPATKQQNNKGQRYINWSYDLTGRLVTPGAPLFNRCSGNASPNGGVNLSPDCGTVVAAIVMPLRENPDLALSLQVGVVDQAGGYALITGTGQALAQADQQRREQETAKAAKSAAPPKL